MKKTLIIVIAITASLIVSAGIFIYFVTGVSATYSPIRKYSYSGSTDQLVIGFRKYSASNSDVTFRIKDTTGNVNNYALYMDIKVRNMEYTLKCEELLSEKSNTLIMLVGVFDTSNNVGGYSKDTKDIDLLVKRFVSDVLTPLKTEVNIEIEPL